MTRTLRRLQCVAMACAAVALAACGSSAASGGRVTGLNASPACRGPATARATSDVKPIATDAIPQLPTTTKDVTGRRVTVRDASRILALDAYGTLATTVHVLGLGDRLVGRDVSTSVAELRDLPVVTRNGHDLNAEAILELRPSVVLTDYTIGPLEVQLQLIDAGVPVVIMSDERSRETIGPQIREVADVLGVPALGRRLATRVEDEIRAAESRIADLAPARAERIRMAFLYMRGSAGVFYWFGAESGADDLIGALRGRDVASETGLRGRRPINAEGLVRADPELILMMTDGLRSVGGITGLLERPGIARTQAGRSRCVVDMADARILSFGPAFAATLDALATAIYDDALAGAVRADASRST